MTRPAALNARQKRFVELYDGPGTGVEAARGAGYKGDRDDLAATASRLLALPKVRAAIEARGVALPGDDEDELPPTGREPTPAVEVPGDPVQFWTAVASGAIRVSKSQSEAMRRKEMALRASAPGTSAEAQSAELRDKVQTALRGMRRRRSATCPTCGSRVEPGRIAMKRERTTRPVIDEEEPREAA